MRLPVAVLMRPAKLADHIARLQPFADLAVADSLGGQVAPQAVENEPIRLVPQQHRMPVVERQVGLEQIHDRCIERRAHVRSRRCEQIEPQMHRAPLIRRKHRTEGVRRIDRPLFAPRADAEIDSVLVRNRAPQTLRLLRLARRRRLGDRVRWIAERNRRFRSQGRCLIQYGTQLTLMRADPADHRPRTRRRFEPAGVPQDAGRQSRIHGAQSLQHGPGRRFADVEIRIVLHPLAPRCRERHARHQAHRDQVEQQVQLLGLQRIDPVIGSRNAAGDIDRRRLVQHGIGAGDRQLPDGGAVDRIAEVDQAGDARADRSVHQQVVVVGIAVDHLRT